ncbi:uncharacterized protein LOC142322756 isoform X2 [Lycorma delicatula]|uniref:uncharacterized protein LOC142322756 isoform X2 n=1 Tax=Lycorma delicatula TaxID=130591 RepID=UPI003F51A420
MPRLRGRAGNIGRRTRHAQIVHNHRLNRMADQLTHNMMDTPVTASNSDTPVSTCISSKLETGPKEMEETVCLFLPHIHYENDTFDHEVDLAKLKEDPLDCGYNENATDPLAVEGTNLIKSENLEIKHEVEEEELFVDGGAVKHEFEVEIDNLFIQNVKAENDLTSVYVTTNREMFEESAVKSCIMCKKSVGNFTGDEIMIAKCDDCCTSFQGRSLQLKLCNDVIFDNFGENINTENTLNEEKGVVTELICKYCNKKFQRRDRLMRHINTHTKDKSKVVKTSAQRSKEYRERKKLSREKKVAKTPAQRSKEYRERKKLSQNKVTKIDVHE